MAKNKLPPGWDEERIQRVLAHYETQSEDEALADDQTSLHNLGSQRQGRQRRPAQ